MKKIELNITSFMLIEGIFLLFFIKESILNILLGTILSIILSLIIKKIRFNKFIKIILLIISIILAITILSKISFFISYNLLRNYPLLIIIISFLIIAIILSNKGYHTFIKAIELSSYFYLFIKIITFFLLIFNIDINNLNYLLIKELNINYNFILISLFISYINISIKYLTDYTIKIKNNLINIINPILIKLLCILIVGETLTNIYNYPYVNILKRIKYLDFIERMEGILLFPYLICFYFLLSYILLLIKSLITNKKQNN